MELTESQLIPLRAMARERDEIAKEANEAISKIGEAMGQLLRMYADNAGLPEGRVLIEEGKLVVEEE